MNSDLIPPSKPSNSAREAPQTGVQAAKSSETSPSAIPTGSEPALSNRQQPIPPPSEPMQYRAIGLVRGRYTPSAEQLTQGTLVATDGTEINAVLLGRIISLLKNHLDLNQDHLWVVYPRTRQQDGDLHLQIVGVWEPENLSKNQAPEPSAESSSEIQQDYFSIRGEIVYQSPTDEQLIVKIKQAPRQDAEKPKYFKLQLQGVLSTKAVRQFWNLHIKRQRKNLVIQGGEMITQLAMKPKLKKNLPPQEGKSGGKTNVVTTSRPVPKIGESKPITRPVSKSPLPKPIKRQKPPQ